MLFHMTGIRKRNFCLTKPMLFCCHAYEKGFSVLHRCVCACAPVTWQVCQGRMGCVSHRPLRAVPVSQKGQKVKTDLNLKGIIHQLSTGSSG